MCPRGFSVGRRASRRCRLVAVITALITTSPPMGLGKTPEEAAPNALHDPNGRRSPPSRVPEREPQIDADAVRVVKCGPVGLRNRERCDALCGSVRHASIKPDGGVAAAALDNDGDSEAVRAGVGA